MYYSTALDSTDIFTSSKGKAFVSTSSVKVYNKKALNDEIYRLTITNV